VCALDFLPTMCEVAGTSVPASLKIDGQSFLAQLRGEKGNPREWIYSWYARDGGVHPQWEYAMSKSYKLYRDGTFFDLTADWFEEKPLAVNALKGQAAAAAKELQSVLDRYAKARPAHVAAVGEPEVRRKEAEARKKEGKKKG
jgi:arylsulfatase A